MQMGTGLGRKLSFGQCFIKYHIIYWGCEMTTINNNRIVVQETVMGGIVSSLKLSPNCICTEEAVKLYGSQSVRFIDVRPVQHFSNAGRIPKIQHYPFDKMDIVKAFMQDRLGMKLTSNITHYIFVCEYGLRSEYIARQLFDKGVANVYHLCGGLSHHEEELQRLI